MSVQTAAPPLLTAEEFTSRYAGRHAELVRGIVKEYAVPFHKHGKVCSTINALIWNHVNSADCGHVTGNDSWIKVRRDPDTVRGADVSYFSYERLPRGEVPDGLLDAVPDLVIEVRSPSDRWKDVNEKIQEYLAAGVRAVIFLDPSAASATVYRADEFPQTFHNGGELTVPDVLPGFAVSLRTLFA